MDKLPDAVKQTILEVLAGHHISTISCLEISSNSCKVHITTGHQESWCLFVKYLDDDALARFFHNELVFYGEISVLFQRLRLQRDFVPHCYAVQSQPPHPCLVLQDLSERQALNVHQPLTLPSARMILTSLARFHAASFALKHLHYEDFTQATSMLRESLFLKGQFRQIFLHAMHDVLKLVKSALPGDSLYVKKFGHFVLDVFDQLCSLVRANEEDREYQVITHGDLWPGNILLKTPLEGDTTRNAATFIDYQACRLASPVHDLLLILLVGLDRPTRENHLQELIQKDYHHILCTTLQELGCDPLRLFPYSALQLQLRRHAKVAMSLALLGLPLHLNDLKASPNTTPQPQHDLFAFIRDIHQNKTRKCKDKMLEIVMDIVDLKYL